MSPSQPAPPIAGGASGGGTSGGGGGSDQPAAPGDGTGGGSCPIDLNGNPDCSGGSGPAAQPNPAPSTGAGNPINLINGNKYQEETDLAALPGVLGLELKRYYNSKTSYSGLVGANWRTSYETVLYDLGSQVQIIQADGRSIMFERGVGTRSGLCSSPQPQDGQVRIEEPRHPGGSRTFHWRWPDGRTLMFTEGIRGGYPLHAITAPGGQRLTIKYDPIGDLISVIDPQGRELSFIYANRAEHRSRDLKAIRTPFGLIGFTQDKRGRLTEVAYSDAARDPQTQSAPYKTMVYHYEDRYNGGHQRALTGISVRTQDPQTRKPVEQRLASYVYNQAGLGILTTKGWPREVKDGKIVAGTGVEQVEFDYVAKSLPTEGRPDRVTGEVQPRQLGKTIVTNSLGQKTEALHTVVGGHQRLVEMKGPGCSTCAATNVRYAYNAAGQVLRETRLDDEGRPTDSEVMRYDGYGRILKIGHQVHAKSARKKAGAEPIEWTRRFEYADVHYQDGSIALAPKPSVIAQPSVVAGREFITRIEYGMVGTASAYLPIKITQTGWAPAVPSAEGKGSEGLAPITRSNSYRYVEQGPAAGQIESVDGPLPGAQDTTRTTYTGVDARNAQGERIASGLPLSVTHPEGLIERFDYDGSGRVIVHVPVDGVPVHYDYADKGIAAGVQPVRVTRAGMSTQTSYDDNGKVARIVRPDGLAANFAYDLAKRLTDISDSNGYRIAMHYDAEGNPINQQWFEPGANKPLRANYRWYDEQGRMKASLRADGWIDEFDYKGQGREPVKHTDGLLNTTHWLTSAASDASAIVRIGFDGELSAAIDGVNAGSAKDKQPEAPTETESPRRLVQSLSDDFGRTLWIRLADHGQRWASYDDASRLIEMRYADGTVVRYERDALGRLIKKETIEPGEGKPASVVSKPSETVTLRYGGGQLAEVNDPAQRTVFRYDDAGRLVERQVAINKADANGQRDSKPSVLATYSIRYGYDAKTGRRISEQLADGRTLYTDYDAKTGAPRAIRMSNNGWRDKLVSLWGGEVGTPVISGIALHPFNGITTAIAGNGVRTERGYDIAGRLTRIGVNGVMQLEYGYGAGTQIKEHRQQWQGPTGQPGAPGVMHAKYEYSSWGRWKGAVPALRPETPARPMKTSFANQTTPPEIDHQQYDARGQLIADGERRYRYNGQGRLIGVVETRAAVPRELARYAYNAWGERVSKTVFDQGEVRTSYFLYEGQRIAAEIDAGGAITSQYLYMNGTPYAKLESASPTGEERTLYIHTDARGMPLAMTDQRRNIVWRSDDKLEEQAWGRMEAIYAPEQAASGWQKVMHTASFGRWGAGAQNAAHLNLRLPGQYLDEETGLHYNYQRYYDPKVHRYITPDPMGYRDAADPYAFVAADPINKVDPLGLYQIDVHYYATFFLALAAGVDTEEARMIALATQYVDENPMTRPTMGESYWELFQSPLLNQDALPRYHFTQEGFDPPRTAAEMAAHVLTGGDLDSYIKRRVANPDNPQLRRLMDASDKAPTRCAKLQLFGEYLHAFEDTFAHRDKDNNPYAATKLGIGLGHGLAAGENPDYTYNHFSFGLGFGYWGENYDRTIEMEKEVFAKMSGFSNPKNFKLSWKSIEYTMEQFTKFEAKGSSDNLDAKIKILNDGLKAFGFDESLTLDGKLSFDKDKAEKNRDKFLADLKPEDFVGTILPQGTAPLPKK